jgi:hypothetical protein
MPTNNDATWENPYYPFTKAPETAEEKKQLYELIHQEQQQVHESIRQSKTHQTTLEQAAKSNCADILLESLDCQSSFMKSLKCAELSNQVLQCLDFNKRTLKTLGYSIHLPPAEQERLLSKADEMYFNQTSSS